MSAEQAGARRAALLLHSMGLEDRRWMLDALPGPQQAQLVALLAELQAIGIARDPLLIESVTAGGRTAAVDAPAAVEPALAVPAEEALQRVDECQLVALIEALRLEPTALVVHVLRLENWAWRDRLLEALPDGQRHFVLRLLAEADMPRVPSALGTALVDALRQIAADPRSEPTPARRARARWSASLHRMLRRPASEGSAS